MKPGSSRYVFTGLLIIALSMSNPPDTSAYDSKKDENALTLREQIEERRVKHQKSRVIQKSSIQDYIQSLPPEKREEAASRIKEKEALFQELREEIKDLSPEERKARLDALRDELQSKRAERKKQLEKRWENASPEDKKSFCDKAKRHCNGNQRNIACDMQERMCKQEG